MVQVCHEYDDAIPIPPRAPSRVRPHCDPRRARRALRARGAGGYLDGRAGPGCGRLPAHALPSLPQPRGAAGGGRGVDRRAPRAADRHRGPGGHQRPVPRIVVRWSGSRASPGRCARPPPGRSCARRCAPGGWRRSSAPSDRSRAISTRQRRGGSSAVIAYLCSANAWVSIDDESGLPGDEIRAAVTWAIETLLADVRRRGEARRDADQTGTGTTDEEGRDV